MSSKKYLPGPESYREFRETAPASFLTKSCFIFEFCVICSLFSSYGCLQFVFEFIVPVLDASFSSSFVLRFRVHFSCFGCFVFELIFAVLGASFSGSLFLFLCFV